MDVILVPVKWQMGLIYPYYFDFLSESAGIHSLREASTHVTSQSRAAG